MTSISTKLIFFFFLIWPSNYFSFVVVVVVVVCLSCGTLCGIDWIKCQPCYCCYQGVLEFICGPLGNRPVVVCDVHGHSRRFNVFFYGCCKLQSWTLDDRSSSPDDYITSRVRIPLWIFIKRCFECVVVVTAPAASKVLGCVCFFFSSFFFFFFFFYYY